MIRAFQSILTIICDFTLSFVWQSCPYRCSQLDALCEQLRPPCGGSLRGCASPQGWGRGWRVMEVVGMRDRDGGDGEGRDGHEDEATDSPPRPRTGRFRHGPPTPRTAAVGAAGTGQSADVCVRVGVWACVRMCESISACACSMAVCRG